MISSGPAVIAAWGVALTPLLIVASTQVWPDVPGAAACLAVFFVYALGLKAEEFGRWRVVAVLALISVAMILRFGAPIPLGLGLVGVTGYLWPRAVKHKGRVAAIALGGSLIVGLVLLTPLATGTIPPTGTISVGSSENPALGGFADYWAMRNRLIGGIGAVMATGLVIGTCRMSSRRWERKAFVWSLVTGIATAAAIASVVHGEARYLSPAYPFLWLAAATGLWGVVRRTRVVTRSILQVLTLSLVLAITPSLADDAQLFNRGFTTIETAARTLNNGEPCGVFTSYTPQVAWYSHCRTENIDFTKLVVESNDLPQGAPTYLFIVQNGKRQPDAELLEEYIEHTTGVPVAFGPSGRSLRYVEIWTLKG
jgi:hypothetical protein